MSDEPIRTDVGWVTYGDNLFRGHSITRDIFAASTRWGALSLGFGHRLLDHDESAFLDDLTVAVSAADPRIPPLKATWLAGCYGSVFVAMAAAHQLLARATLGPTVATSVGQLWCDLAAHLEGAGGRDDAILDFFTRRKAAGDLPPGFGSVPGRPEDERLVLIQRAAERHGRHDLAFTRLARDAGPVLRSCGMQSNLMGELTACLLDLGFAIDQLAPMSFAVMSHSLWANAYEAARLRPMSLQRVDASAVHYVGRRARPSGRM